MPWRHIIPTATLLMTFALAGCGEDDGPSPVSLEPAGPNSMSNNASDNAEPGNNTSANNTSTNNTSANNTSANNTSTPGEPIGAACAASSECDGDMVCDVSAPGGYCRASECGTACTRHGGVCASPGGHGVGCWAPCDPSLPPREGYDCVEVGDAGDVMLPQEALTEEVSFEQLGQALGVECTSVASGSSQFGPTREFDFEVSADANGFLMVPHLLGTGEFYPISLFLPDGTEVDLVGDYRHHNARRGDMTQAQVVGQGEYGEIGIDWPMLVPYAPGRADMLMPGRYRLRVAGPEDLCFYMVESKGGVKIDLNFHFVGSPGLTASTAPSDEDFQQVLSRFGEIYAKADVELGQIRYFDVSPEVAQQYAIVRDMADIRSLTAHARAHGTRREDNLSVNIFLVQSVYIQNGLVLGVSGGIPGAAGMHGNSSNGLVFSSVDIGTSNYHVAHIMAHEVGHFLGLRHTTELVNGVGGAAEQQFDDLVGVTDPLDDTPICENVIRVGTMCPDFSNLMFPSAPPPSLSLDPQVSAAQADVLQRSPLTYE